MKLQLSNGYYLPVCVYLCRQHGRQLRIRAGRRFEHLPAAGRSVTSTALCGRHKKRRLIL